MKNSCESLLVSEASISPNKKGKEEHASYIYKYKLNCYYVYKKTLKFISDKAIIGRSHSVTHVHWSFAMYVNTSLHVLMIFTVPQAGDDFMVSHPGEFSGAVLFSFRSKSFFGKKKVSDRDPGHGVWWLVSDKLH